MPVNPYFNHNRNTNEQDLLQDLIDESIQMYGHMTYYIRRENANLDYLLGEDPISQYTNAVPVEMYIKSSSSFQGQGDFISKFGLHIEDQCTFSISRRRFEQLFGLERPHESDIIYLELQANPWAFRPLFEIRFVEQREQLFQLGKLYTYELRCELLQYSHERVQTGIADIDTAASGEAYTITLNLGTGTGTYIVGETVFEGNTFLTASATGEVLAYNSTAKTLQLQNITGTFSNTEVVGVTSAAEWTITTTPETADGGDNIIIRNDAENVIVVRGTNPRRQA